MVKKRKDSPLNEEEWNKWQIELKSAKEKKKKADSELKKEVESIVKLARQWEVKDEEGHVIDDYIKEENDSEEFPTVGIRMKIIALAAKDCRENADEFKRKYPQIWKSGSVLAIEDFAGDGRKEVLIKSNITSYLGLDMIDAEQTLKNSEKRSAHFNLGENSSREDDSVELVRENKGSLIKCVHQTRSDYNHDKPQKSYFVINTFLTYNGEGLQQTKEEKKEIFIEEKRVFDKSK